MQKLHRFIQARKIAGICAGLAEYFRVDPFFFRLAFLVSMVFGGIGIVVYLVMWVMVPPTNAPASFDSLQAPHLSESDHKLLGVCGGLGKYFGVDPIFFRVAAVVLLFFGGMGLLLYIALWLLMPAAHPSHGADSGDLVA